MIAASDLKRSNLDTAGACTLRIASSETFEVTHGYVPDAFNLVDCGVKIAQSNRLSKTEPGRSEETFRTQRLLQFLSDLPCEELGLDVDEKTYMQRGVVGVVHLNVYTR